jgi:hypothetical protein
VGTGVSGGVVPCTGVVSTGRVTGGVDEDGHA